MRLINTKEAQRQRLLALLRQKSVTIFEARRSLDIIGVASRVHELRHQEGYNIQTYWDMAINPGGGTHRIAKYVLLPGKFQGGIN